MVGMSVGDEDEWLRYGSCNAGAAEWENRRWRLWYVMGNSDGRCEREINRFLTYDERALQRGALRKPWHSRTHSAARHQQFYDLLPLANPDPASHSPRTTQSHFVKPIPTCTKICTLLVGLRLLSHRGTPLRSRPPFLLLGLIVICLSHVLLSLHSPRRQL